MEKRRAHHRVLPSPLPRLLVSRELVFSRRSPLEPRSVTLRRVWDFVVFHSHLRETSKSKARGRFAPKRFAFRGGWPQSRLVVQYICCERQSLFSGAMLFCLRVTHFASAVLAHNGRRPSRDMAGARQGSEPVWVSFASGCALSKVTLALCLAPSLVLGFCSQQIHQLGV